MSPEHGRLSPELSDAGLRAKLTQYMESHVPNDKEGYRAEANNILEEFGFKTRIGDSVEVDGEDSEIVGLQIINNQPLVVARLTTGEHAYFGMTEDLFDIEERVHGELPKWHKKTANQDTSTGTTDAQDNPPKTAAGEAQKARKSLRQMQREASKQQMEAALKQDLDNGVVSDYQDYLRQGGYGGHLARTINFEKNPRRERTEKRDLTNNERLRSWADAEADRIENKEIIAINPDGEAIKVKEQNGPGAEVLQKYRARYAEVLVNRHLVAEDIDLPGKVTEEEVAQAKASYLLERRDYYFNLLSEYRDKGGKPLSKQKLRALTAVLMSREDGRLMGEEVNYYLKHLAGLEGEDDEIEKIQQRAASFISNEKQLRELHKLLKRTKLEKADKGEAGNQARSQNVGKLLGASVLTLIDGDLVQLDGPEDDGSNPDPASDSSESDTTTPEAKKPVGRVRRWLVGLGIVTALSAAGGVFASNEGLRSGTREVAEEVAEIPGDVWDAMPWTPEPELDLSEEDTELLRDVVDSFPEQ